MTFYGIERKDGIVTLQRWTARTAKTPRKAMDWAYYPNAGQPIKKRGRQLYMVPKGWRRDTSLCADGLARSVEAACREAEADGMDFDVEVKA